MGQNDHDLRTIAQKTKDRTTRTPQKTSVNSGAPERWAFFPAPETSKTAFLNLFSWSSSWLLYIYDILIR
jgi:hypothetical protein